MNPARGSHGTWEEGEGSAMPVGIPVMVALHLFACLVFQEPVWAAVTWARLVTSRVLSGFGLTEPF